jgi:nucleotide-binding universal stress UspA family protein
MSHRGIVVGLDDSRSARTALRWAADYARHTGLALRAVHVELAVRGNHPRV